MLEELALARLRTAVDPEIGFPQGILADE